MATATIPDFRSDGASLPRVLDAVLIVRVGEPLGASRGGWRKDVTFDLDEVYAVFREKCLAKFSEVAASPEAAKKRVQLRSNSDVYLKRTKNDGQCKYVRLCADNFRSSLEHRWRLLKPADRLVINAFRFQAFLYAQSTAQPPAQFHRATAARIERARLQRVAHEAVNSISFGPITAHHLDIVQARRPDSAPFEVPQDNTTAQAMELDRQRELIRVRESQQARQAQQETATVRMMFNGAWVPVRLDLATLRRACGLPDHDVFASGIFQSFSAPAPSNPEQEDVDHMQEDDENRKSDEEAGGLPTGVTDE